MPRFLARLLWFGAILTAAYLLVLAVLAHAAPDLQRRVRELARIPVGVVEPRGDTFLRFREIEKYRDVDILFVGSSHCYRAFDPRLFAERGLSIFNMGSSAQTPVNSYFLLRRYLESLHPRLMVFEVYENVLQADGVESLLDLCRNTEPALDLFLMAVATNSFSGVTGYLLDRFDPHRRPTEEHPPGLGAGDRYVRGGFVEKDPSFVREQTFPPPGPMEMLPQQLTFLRRSLRLARSTGSRTVVVMQPVPSGLTRRITNHKDNIVRLQALAEEERSRFLDFTGIAGLDDRESYIDGDHLNQKGVRSFDAALLEQLGKLDLVPRSVPE